MTTGTKTLNIRADTLRLSEADPAATCYPPEFRRIHIEADTLCVEGWIQWFGREVTILARRIVATPVGGRIAVIDVSGAPAEPTIDPTAPSSRPRGTPAAPNGQPGQRGGDGRAGGSLTVLVDVIDGELGLAANGSQGGNGERGSDGVKPARPDGRDGALNKGNRPTKGPFGGRVLAPWKKWSADSYIVVAYGERGGDARPGGDAGAPGQPGRGGDGGQVSLSCTGAVRPTVRTTAIGAAAGQPGAPAAAGPAGQAGVGGRNRMLVVDWRHTWHQGYAHEGRNGWVLDAAKKYGVPRRAAGGAGPAAAGAVPPPPGAAAGADGRVDVAGVAMKVSGARVGLPFLTYALAHAERRLRAGDHDEARARFRWLAQVAAPRAASDADAAAVRAAAQAALEALDATPPRRPNGQRRSRTGRR